MSLYESIQGDMKSAMKSGDKAVLSTLRMIVSAVNYESIDSSGDKGDELVVRVLRREAKKRRESIEAYTTAGRDELAEQEEAELRIIEGYLPALMSEDEIRAKVSEVIDQREIDFGTAMRESMQALGGQADGKVVARIVGEIVASK